jgi:hypothetical protein
VVNAVLGIETVEAAHSFPLHCFAGKLKATLPNTSVSVTSATNPVRRQDRGRGSVLVCLPTLF